MIETSHGDILACGAEALVNTVNCVGVMGRGIALQFKKAFPDNYKAYAEACRRGQVMTGRMFVFETGRLAGPRFIINFPTKRHWRNASRLQDIESGLQDLARTIRELGIRSIAIPPLGCGLGGLSWGDVEPMISRFIGGIDEVHAMVFQPEGAPETSISTQVEIPAMTRGRAALVELSRRYLSAVLDPDITLLEIHKLMYFLQESGEPLRLRFVQAPHGPYAENLRHVMRVMEGHFIDGYGDGGDSPDKPISFRQEAIEEAGRFISEDNGLSARIDRVAELVDGFESSFGMELLATVHWLLRETPGLSGDDLAGRVYGWNPQKRKFSRRQIEVARSRLEGLGWIHGAS